MRRPFLPLLAISATLLAAPLAAQPTLIVYKLGSDTVAVEQYTRTADRIVGEIVQRAPTAVIRTQYDVALARDGRQTTATIRRLQQDGTPAAGASTTRFRFTADSSIREIVWPDSVQRRAFPGRAVFNMPTYMYGLTETIVAMRRAGSIDSLVALGTNGNPSFTGLQSIGDNVYRLRGGFYLMELRFDANGRLLSVDGANTTNKIRGERTNAPVDLAAIARSMKPTGALSGRDIARATFGTGGLVLVDYGRPSVRERTVWGGTLVPFDSIWRAGANDATHLFTARNLTFGDLNVPAGMYTLWVQHTRNGTFLIVNKQTGIWGTQYNPAQDLGRVQMQVTPTQNHVEEFTLTVRNVGNNRGVIEMAWGPSMAVAQFTASVAR